MRVGGLKFPLNLLRRRRACRKSKTLRRRATAKTKPTPRRMRRRKPQAIRTPARGSAVIITTTPDDITAGTVDITPAGTAGNGAALWVCSRALPQEGQGSFLLLWLCDVW